MSKLDYSTLPPRCVLSAYGWAAAACAALVVLVCGGLTIPGHLFFVRLRAANVIGKTQAQITARLGPPDPWHTTTEPDGTVIVVYNGPGGTGYRIDVRTGWRSTRSS